MTEQQMIADGWRRCAVGQRETQQCGLVDGLATSLSDHLVGLGLARRYDGGTR